MKILLAHAIKEEKVDITIPNAEVAYVETGVAKARAALRLMHAVCEFHPDMVINFGTSGTVNHKVGDIIICNRFVDRDLRNVHFGDVISEIKFEDINLSKLLGKELNAISLGTVNTGDSFVTEVADFEGDCIDMEAFAEADVLPRDEHSFHCREIHHRCRRKKLRRGMAGQARRCEKGSHRVF